MKSGKIIEFGGVDGCGKSTQLSLMSEDLRELGYDIHIPKTAVQCSKLYPQSLDERKRWYASSTPETIIEANIDGTLRRFEDAMKSKADYVLLDRGFYTTKSSSIAHMCLKYAYDDAKDYVENEYEKHGISDFEDEHLFYTASFDTICERLGDECTPGFMVYLSRFYDSMHDSIRESGIRPIYSERPLLSVRSDSLATILFGR